MGHATISETLDAYAHIMPGGAEDLRAKANAYLASEGERAPLYAVR